MKLLVAFLFVFSIQAQSILDECYNASYATDYVHEDIFSVSVNEELVSDEFYELISNDAITILSKRGSRYTLKVSLKDWFNAESILEELRELPAVMVACKYKL
ncbi:MAG: hypothetical protein BM556_06600 [Bacteriovorax sp. MedPE-SWde]|nr:MAG: hypothetical protein BM556_06600 [Bacteriovorax sp. MedPE-SWde]